MSELSASVTLVGDRRTYAARDTIRGTFHTRALREVKAQAVTVSFVEVCRIDGGTRRSPVTTVELPWRSWREGQVREEAFELVIPFDAPSTYRGERLEVRWYVEARVDVVYGVCPDVVEPITLRAPPRVVRSVDVASAPAGAGGGCAMLFASVIPLVWGLMAACAGGVVGGVLAVLSFAFFAYFVAIAARNGSTARRARSLDPKARVVRAAAGYRGAGGPRIEVTMDLSRGRSVEEISLEVREVSGLDYAGALPHQSFVKESFAGALSREGASVRALLPIPSDEDLPFEFRQNAGGEHTLRHALQWDLRVARRTWLGRRVEARRRLIVSVAEADDPVPGRDGQRVDDE